MYGEPMSPRMKALRNAVAERALRRGRTLTIAEKVANLDATRILVARINEEIGDGDIEISEWCSIKRERYEWVEGDLFRRANDPPYEFWNGNGHRATHWMPLPPPPASVEKEEGRSGRTRSQ